MGLGLFVRARFPALLSRNYRLYWMGQGVSLIGTWMQSVAVGWLVWRLSHSPFLLGLVGVAMTLPILAFSLYAGVVADRFVRRRVILVTQVLAMVQAFTLAALVTWGTPSVGLVLALVAVSGLINAFDLPARQSFISETVDRAVLPNAIALHSTIFNAARLIGPALAGLVLATLGEAPCFWINAFSFVAVLWGLLRMDLPERRPERARGSAVSHMIEGVRYAWGDSRLRNLLVLLGTAGSIGFQYTVLLPVYAGGLLHPWRASASQAGGTGAGGYGLLMSAIGVGSLFAALVMTRAQDRRRLRRNVLFGLALFGAALVAFSQNRIFELAVAINAIAGFGMILYAASTNTLVQLTVEEKFRGRIMSLYTLMFIGTAPAGSFVLGAVAERFGAPAATMISGLTCALGATWVFFRLRVLERREAPLPPPGTAPGPA
ncbi:MAG: MFS transporter [Candidatus Eisenbacteria bacterium]